MKKIFILFIALSSASLSFNLEKSLNEASRVIPKTKKIEVNGKSYILNTKRLMLLTSGVESNFGIGKRSDKYAKTNMQYEIETVNHVFDKMKEEKKEIENKLGRKIKLYDENDAVYVSWLIYEYKYKFHKNWLGKYSSDHFKQRDVEYFYYKIFYNSVKGKTNHEKWKYREKLSLEYFENITFDLDDTESILLLSNQYDDFVGKDNKMNNLINSNFNKQVLFLNKEYLPQYYKK